MEFWCSDGEDWVMGAELTSFQHGVMLICYFPIL